MPQYKLDDALEQLVHAELVFRRGVPPDAEYTFKHALVQDAAYNSMLKSKRAQLHSRIARVLEGAFSDAVAKTPEVLAHHFSQAGINERAVPYWTRAGQRDLERVSLAEAVGHPKAALTANERLPESVERDRDELQIRLLLMNRRPTACREARIHPVLRMVSLWGRDCEHQMADAAITEMYSLAKSTGDSRTLITAQLIDACTLPQNGCSGAPLFGRWGCPAQQPQIGAGKRTLEPARDLARYSVKCCSPAMTRVPHRSRFSRRSRSRSRSRQNPGNSAQR